MAYDDFQSEDPGWAWSPYDPYDPSTYTDPGGAPMAPPAAAPTDTPIDLGGYTPGADVLDVSDLPAAPPAAPPTSSAGGGGAPEATTNQAAYTPDPAQYQMPQSPLGGLAGIGNFPGIPMGGGMPGMGIPGMPTQAQIDAAIKAAQDAAQAAAASDATKGDVGGAPKKQPVPKVDPTTPPPPPPPPPPPAPPYVPPQVSFDDTFNKALRDFLLAQLGPLSKPVSENDPDVSGAIGAFNAQTQRDQALDREALAERFYAMGGNASQSGGFNTGVQQLLEGASANKANFSGNLLWNAGQSKRQQLGNMLNLALGAGQSDVANQIQSQIASIDAQLKAKGLSQQNSQFNDQLGFNYAQLQAQLNRAAFLAAMSRGSGNF